MPKQLSLGLYQPNPSEPNGAIVFNKAKDTSGTMYQRFAGTFVGDNGQAIDALFFLNADLVASQVFTPYNLEMKDIYIPDVDFRVALEKQQPQVLAAGQARIAITNFSIDMDDELKTVITNAAIQSNIAANSKRADQVATQKKAYRAALLSGRASSSLDPRLLNRDQVSQMPAHHTVGANEAGAGVIGGGKGLTQPDGTDADSSRVHAEVLEAVTTTGVEGGQGNVQNTTNPIIAQNGPNPNPNAGEENPS